MMSGENERIRIFPFRPTPERGSFTDFIEQTGANRLLIEAVKKLYEVPNKPENPIEWLRLYFKYLTPDRTKEMQETEELLKAELTEIEAKVWEHNLINALEEENIQNEALKMLERENKKITMVSRKNQHYDDFRKYLNHPDDYHYRVQPNPSYQPSKSDMLLVEEDRSVTSMLYPTTSTGFVPGVNPEDTFPKEDPQYDDYLSTYFPQFVPKVESSEEEEEAQEDEEEGSEEEGEGESEETGDRITGSFGVEQTLSSAGGSPPGGQRLSNTGGSDDMKKLRQSKLTEAGKSPKGKAKGKQKGVKGLPSGMPSTIKIASPVPPPAEGVPEQEIRVSIELPKLPHYEPDPLMATLGPVESSFWKNDFSVSRGKDDLGLASEHFNYEKVTLTKSALTVTAGSLRRTLPEEEDNPMNHTEDIVETFKILNRNWIMDAHLADPSFANALVYNGVPYDMEKAVRPPYGVNSDDEISSIHQEHYQNGRRSTKSLSTDRGPISTTASASPPCECECPDQSRCSSSYCPTVCRTSTSISSYKEDDNTVGRRTAPSTMPYEDNLEEAEGEEDEGIGMYSETVAPSSARFEEENENIMYN